MILEISPLSKTIGAEIHNLNLSNDLDKNILMEIKNAFLENIVLLFRKQSLDPDNLINFTKFFVLLNRNDFFSHKTMPLYYKENTKQSKKLNN